MTSLEVHPSIWFLPKTPPTLTANICSALPRHETILLLTDHYFPHILSSSRTSAFPQLTPSLSLYLHSWALQNNSPIFSTCSSHISTFLISLSLITLTCCTSFPTKALTLAFNTSALLLLNVQPHIQFTTSLSFCFCHLSPCWMPRLPCLLLLSSHTFLYLLAPPPSVLILFPFQSIQLTPSWQFPSPAFPNSSLPYRACLNPSCNSVQHSSLVDFI